MQDLKANREKYDIKCGYGMFIVANIIYKEDKFGYIKKGSWFQKLCEESMNEIPMITPSQAKKLSNEYLESYPHGK